MASSRNDASIHIRLSSELKRTIEDAAAEMGLTVSDFAVFHLVESARRILDEQQSTRLSDRDRERFVAMLDDEASKPKASLQKAAVLYKKQVD
jgi:uncharacterized protein (DUF1778 family)